ncbi:MAG: M20/M25/M40 family metallo-hydrolase, partial [Stenotrophomonas sp.]|nr:M20/M25/M40 family metallo-hydrolase [Stenotrophomonas sp.]
MSVMTDDAKARVSAQIDATADDLIAFLSAYVQQRSVNPGRATTEEPGGTRDAQIWLRDELATWECFDSLDLWEVETDQPNLATVAHGSGQAGQALVYNGHTDTVQVSPEQRAEWIGGDPFSGAVIDGKLYGRGSTDMKSGNAAFAWAIRAIKQVGLSPASDVTATFSIGEETG